MSGVVNPTPAPSDHPLSLSSVQVKEAAAKIAEAHAKSVKSDDAPTDEDFWNWNAATYPDGSSPNDLKWKIVSSRYDKPTHGLIFNFLRSRMERRFKRNVTASARRYLRLTYSEEELRRRTSSCGELEKDLEGIKDALHRVRGTTFWDWPRGSYPFFWRWQPEVKKDMRDGTPIWIRGKLPKFRTPQRLPADPITVEKVKEKVNKVRRRKYVAPGPVHSLTSYFCVPKGENDIRMVYDLTACGLNDALWAPTFWLPTMQNVLDCATHSSWFSDIDAGDMFLNYPLDVKIRPYAGIDVSWAHEGEDEVTIWERWTRMAMGLVSSPWVTIRLYAWAHEIIRGDRRDTANPFHWDTVVINCPGDPNYDPSMPRLYKWNSTTGAIAGDCKTFVDDGRPISNSRANCRAVTHQIETMMGYLGLQDATRKRRPDSQAPGEWTGTLMRAIEGVGLFVTVSQVKWDKVKNILSSLRDEFTHESDLPSLDLKDLEKKVGFLVHLAMAYPLMFPFLKGFYLTMNSWRPKRDENGWKMSKKAHEAFMALNGKGFDATGISYFKDEEDKAPEKVTASPLLWDHLSALLELFESTEPTLRLIRGHDIVEVMYVFGDASGAGFASSWSDGKPAEFIDVRVGVWGDIGYGSTSNRKEFRNLVETLEHMGSKGDLEGREVFIFTDNMVSETIASKGSSKSEDLYHLVVRVYKLEMRYKCSIKFIHVAGTRMIQQGTDGLSRGDMVEGVMQGLPMLSFISLHKDAFQVSPPLKLKIQETFQGYGNEVEFLTPSGWFERGHDFWGSRRNCDGIWMPAYKAGTMVWAPPPGAARQVLEELRQARLKRQNSLHVFVCPRLEYDGWRRHMFKSADAIFYLPAGKCESWPAAMHETLIIAVYLPYLPRCPWELRKTGLLVGLEKQMRRLFKEDPASGWALLSEFSVFARSLASLPIRNLRRVLSGKSKFAFSG